MGLGQDIVFGAGQYQPRGAEGQRLLAHELVHVVQQGALIDIRPSSTLRPLQTAQVIQRAVSPELDKIESYLSYGIFDWKITDEEAVKALELLKTLPRFQQAVFFADPKYVNRLRENLPENRLPELNELEHNLGSIRPPTPTVEDVRSKLSYGLFDWVVTDKEAVEALEMLKQLSGAQLATALAAINYGRLMDNLPDARKPELIDLLARGLGTGGARQTEEKQHPGTALNSLTFLSDHRMMKDNVSDWTSSGTIYSRPDWFVSNGKVVSHPISQTRNTNVQIEASLNVLPANAPTAPIRLSGRSDMNALNFEFAGSMHGGLDQKVLLTSTGKLPDAITAVENKEIIWMLEWRDWKHEIARTGGHTIFVTITPPLVPDEVTFKRMSTAVRLTRVIGTIDPHPLVRGIMRRWGAYNLDVQLSNAWTLADNLDVGAQCIDIVRFVNGLLQMVGCPGTATAVIVWAKPDTPMTPEENTWPHGGLHTIGAHPAHSNWFVGLMDANGCPNAYEAALRFVHNGTLRYYPGGVSMSQSYQTPSDVLYIFQCLVWLTKVGSKEFEIQSILATYPHGWCTPGRVRCR